MQPLVELRVAFRLERANLDDAERGDIAIDLDPLSAAAKQIALAENTAVFHGYPAGGIRGITEEAQAVPPVHGEWTDYRDAVASAVARLQGAGIGGPYGLALGDEAWLGVSETIEAGYPLIEHLARVVGGPVVWAPGLSGGMVVSQRGGDFLLDVGQDLSVGYHDHDVDTVTLYLEESLTFRVLEVDAAIAIGA
ncbi:MAG: family 1 encapsulin nanocompartment shell protein [Acidimicrobiales bacterium]